MRNGIGHYFKSDGVQYRTDGSCDAENTYIYIDKTLSKDQQAKTTAHEMYVHGLFFLMGLDYRHSQVKDEIFKNVENKAVK